MRSCSVFVYALFPWLVIDSMHAWYQSEAFNGTIFGIVASISEANHPADHRDKWKVN